MQYLHAHSYDCTATTPQEFMDWIRGHIGRSSTDLWRPKLIEGICIHYVELLDKFPMHKQAGAQCLGEVLSRKGDVHFGSNVVFGSPFLYHVEKQLIDWGRGRELVLLWQHGSVKPSDDILRHIMSLLGECKGENDPSDPDAALSWRGNVQQLEEAMDYLIDIADKSLTEEDIAFLLEPYGDEPFWYPLDLLAEKTSSSAMRIIGSANPEDAEFLREHFGSAGHNVPRKRDSPESERKHPKKKRPRKTKKKARPPKEKEEEPLNQILNTWFAK